MTVGQSAPSREEVLAALARLSSQPGFLDGRTQKPTKRYLLLETLVEQALEGAAKADGQRMWKAVWPDERGEPDPGKVGTTRDLVRKNLRAYYADRGAGDPIRIIVPEHPALPQFTRLELPSVTPAGDPPPAPPVPPSPRQRRTGLWVVAAVIVAIAVGGWLTWDASRCGEDVEITSLRDGQPVGPSEQVSGRRHDPWLSRCKDYLLVETVSPPIGRWVQRRLTGETWHVTSLFGQDDTPDGTGYSVSVVSTTRSLKPGIAPGAQLDDARFSPGVRVQLRRR